MNKIDSTLSRHCTDIDCASRRSKCCHAKPKVSYSSESTSFFMCSKCGKEFIAKEHDCDEDDIGATDFSGSFWIIFTGILFVIACMALIGVIVIKMI